MMFSVVILVHRLPTKIADCLRSLSEHSGNLIREVIVVNDGGPEEIQTMVEKFQNPWSLKYIRNAKNLGVSAARNTGVKNATAPYISIFAENYTIQPNHFQMAANLLEKHPVVASNVVTKGPGIGPKAINANYQFVIKEWTLTHGNAEPHGFIGVNFPAGAASSFRAEVFEEIGLFDENLKSSEDTDFNRRMDDAGIRRIYAPDILVTRWENETIFSVVKKQFGYGRSLFNFREKNKEQHYIRYEIKHGLYIVKRFAQVTKKYHVLPLMFITHFSLRMGILVGIIKKRLKSNRSKKSITK
ncbi:MAG: glycosyltransferase [Cryomorphaceae bacterium]|nr:glycosyltransferase [Cryomorphaceae bacterium]